MVYQQMSTRFESKLNAVETQRHYIYVMWHRERRHIYLTFGKNMRVRKLRREAKDIDTLDLFYKYLKLSFNFKITSKVYTPVSVVLIIIFMHFLVIDHISNPLFARFRQNKKSLGLVSMRNIRIWILKQIFIAYS